MKTKIKERPIIFSGEMIKAILDGRKTQTRRVIKPQPMDNYGPDGEPNGLRYKSIMDGLPNDLIEFCPYGQPGDRLWVQESYCAHWGDRVGKGWPNAWVLQSGEKIKQKDGTFKICSPGNKLYVYHKINMNDKPPLPHLKWIRPFGCYRWASRITLEITELRIERVQDISEAEAKAEGAKKAIWYCPSGKSEAHHKYLGGRESMIKQRIIYKNGFATLWDSINRKRGFGWDQNPWVWVIDFKKIKGD